MIETIKKLNRPKIVLIIFAVIVVVSIIIVLIMSFLNRGGSELTASGTIEAVEINISPEIGGKVAEILVKEGESVSAGDELFRMDDVIVQAQRSVALANLNFAQAAQDTAQAQYEAALDATRMESAALRTSGWVQPATGTYELPGWYFSLDEQIDAAETEVESALAERDQTLEALNDLLQDPANDDLLEAENRLVHARLDFLAAQGALTRANMAWQAAELQRSAQEAYDDAQTELEEAQIAYNNLAGGEDYEAVLSARADAAAAQERYESALDNQLALQVGNHSPRVAAAEAAANQAGYAVEQAQAALLLVDAQITKLTITAPADGVILELNIQAGEVLAGGALAMTLGQLDDLSITVYVPEDRYGELSLGQSASITVDSFPEDSFTAKVSHIADQAEFTPRNVQTVEGRQSTVFAIRLQISDPRGKLKPGMPADVLFISTEEE